MYDPGMSAGQQPSLNPEPAPESTKAPPVNAAAKYWWAAAIAVPLLVALIGIIPKLRKEPSPISIDSHDQLNFQPVTVIEKEYSQKTGQPLPPDVRQQLEEALDLVKRKQYEKSIPLLRAVADKAQVPSVQMDLANALAISGKSAEAENLYAKVAAVDPSNRPVKEGRQFLAKLTQNNTIFDATEIPIETEVQATMPDNGTQFFKFNAPPGPRDLLRVSLQNRSSTMALSLAVKNADKAPVGSGSVGAAAANVSYEFSATPGTTHYLQVSPYTGGGPYSVIVKPTHSFDAFEPNDTILEAKDIPVGSPIEANIMDGNDTDFYRFRARADKTLIVVENRSQTLAISLAVANEDKAPMGGPPNGAAAANVRYEFNSKAGGTYYLQVSPYYSAGKYVLTVQ